MIQTKKTLIKTKAKNSDCVVARNIKQFRRIRKDAVFINNTSDESDNNFECTRHKNLDNQNQNNRHYP